MPATFAEGKYTGEFLISEASGTRSREKVTLITGNNLEAGTVLGKITASGKYTQFDDGAVDGSEVAAGVLYAPVDAAAADAEAVIIARDAEVSADDLVWLVGMDIPAAHLQLAALGIIARA